MVPAGIKERITVPRLYAQPVSRRFGTQQYDQFLEYLDSPENNCLVRTIGMPEDLLLNADGRTHDGMQYSWSGFKSIATLLCDGVLTTLLDMTGVRQTKRQKGLCDFPAAISLFNALVRLRFERFHSSQMVCSIGNKTIDGIVGQSYQFFSNRRYVELLQAQELPAKFLAAELVGRKMSIWLRDTDPSFDVANRRDKIPHWLGYFGSNSEGAHSSVRLTPALFCPYGTSLADYETCGRRQVHTGSDFDNKLCEMFRQVVLTAPAAGFYIAHAERAAELLGMPKNQKQQDRRIDQLTSRVRRGKLPRAIAREIVMQGLLQGSDKQADVQAGIDTGYRFPARSRFDLVCGAMRCGLKIGPARREAVEQTAYAIFTGSINLEE